MEPDQKQRLVFRQRSKGIVMWEALEKRGRWLGHTVVTLTLTRYPPEQGYQVFTLT